MQGNRDYIMSVFAKLVRDNNIEPYNGTDYLDNVEEVMKPISEMQFYKNQNFFADNDLTTDELHDQQMKYIEDNVRDINKRMDTLNVYFERPVKAEYFKRQVRRLVKKNARLAFERGKK